MVRLSFASIFTLSLVTLFSTQVLAIKPGHHDDSLTKPKVLDKFCNNFNAACTDTCLKGKKGEMTVTFSCYKVPPKNQIYHFGCRCNGKEKTQSALKKVAGPIPSTSTTTKSVSSTVTPVVSETVTITSASTASTSTVTQYSLSDGGSSQVLQVVEDAALIQVKVAKKASHNKKSKKPQSTFCKEYSGACDRQCSRVKSSPKTQTCKKTHNGVISDSYNLFCLCKNGKLETQHALADIGNDGATGTQTEIVILGTTTASLTSTFTQVSTKVEVVPSTTLVVLAPTGVVRADNPDGSVYGYIGKTSDYDVMSIHSADAAEVSSVFLVKDPSTGNYEVGFTLQPTLFWKLDGTTTGGDFDSPGYTFANLIQGDSIPPPSNSDGNPSQTFSWNIGALSENANSLNSPIRATLNYELSPRWVHRDGTLLDLQMRTSGSLNSDYGLFATAPNSDNGYPEVNFSFEPENPN